MKIQDLYRLYTISSGIEINSKKVKNGSIFFALKGKNFDGNQFAHEAISNGAMIAIVDNIKYSFPHKNIFFVKNALSSLQELALYHRLQLNRVPIIAITGSNGKTTTKELTTAILSKKYEVVHSTEKNFNNHIGIPLTLLSMPKNTQISVVEIGANQEKEIQKMCSIIHPNYGYITNFGKAHLEGFKNIKGVIRGKLELYNFFKKNKKKVFVNGDDPIQLIHSLGIERYIFSERVNSDVNVPIKYFWNKTDLKSVLCIKDMQIVSSLVGSYNLYNIASAITIGNYFKVPLKKIKKAVEGYIPNNYRSQILEKENVKIIVDCYNANPSSMIETLTFFNKIQGNKIAILGDMLELGSFSKKEHAKIISFLEKSNINAIFLIGEIFSNTNRNSSNRIRIFSHKNIFIQWIKSNSLKADYILIKGSRKNSLESLIHFI
ncbi:UDP-N-acetylmuramoylalanyl-D-glutamyl-2,6-diaminopimelate--D-alanyl-D-alanine ligase [Blattabacterium sp. (Blatta orientalis) str. Tarazona]|uniref:UDP-N-acetylmuramoyl-tripeptide--D-alanyl-D- alanine ligase n=1 Tax=Blattabacterium sp. (Blatta orientalis) TaxID=367806 RepID=UPI0002AD9CDF|nr:UDP-N-acetylmuramoyl-tripeptide--D-alanyl-D-alanine ligase [Blattabacterium sp. (Blatta orientalis)]AGD98011.1 UDP-N-acetylmuramoylalanyl-D-glutamyl-2,6-diaminopimelate--D-alanyl-D-alanine ligase [Blattabacterium sp. (Blatta orientalis) str. Tarazona]